MIGKLKLRHLELLEAENIDYATLMIELNGYKNTWWNKKFIFLKSFAKTFKFIEYVKGLDPSLIERDPNCKIKCPESIDDITFMAMMELQTLLNTDSEKSLALLMAEAIAISCFSENHKIDFNVDGLEFEDFKNRVFESPAIEMLGISNWINKELKESQQHWSQQFFSVEVIDKDYEQAGGHKMSAFNIINTIKSICSDFNYTEKEAWQVSYSLTQINSLSKATSAYIQNQMSIIKEARMKTNRNKK